MARRISTLLILMVLTVVSVRSQQAVSAHQPAQARVVPLKKFSPIHRFETLSGDPVKAGLYVIRIHAEAGYIIMPHIHPEDENIVVVQGSWAAGMGERFNPQALEPMEVGTYALLPKKMAHFALSKTETIIQVHGLGPFTPYYVVPNYELTEKGVMLKTIVTEPAQSASTSPPGCFPLARYPCCCNTDDTAETRTFLVTPYRSNRQRVSAEPNRVEPGSGHLRPLLD